MRRTAFVAGNWKMNGIAADLVEIDAVAKALASQPSVEVAIFPPYTLIAAAARLAGGTPLRIGAQDCHGQVSGAFTGDVSAAMLKDAGASYAIVGHSERRALHRETCVAVRAKAEGAAAAGLQAIVCVGETAGERAAGLAETVCERQLAESVPTGATPDTVIVAYEPVWAIGTGQVAQSHDITTMHGLLRRTLKSRFGEGSSRHWRIIYGGSVTPANGGTIFATRGVDGALVGGASLKAETFLRVVEAAVASLSVAER